MKLFLGAIVLGLALSSCGGRGLPPLVPGLALEFAFEGSCEAHAVTELAHEVPPQGITFESGVEGHAARFDGSGAALKLLGIDALGLRNAMTLEFFMNADDWKNPYLAGGGLESLVSHSDIFTVAVDPHVWRLQARLTCGGREESLRLAGGTIRPGAWHHVALVLDGVRARLVLDGEVVADEPAGGDLSLRPDLHLVVGTWFQRNQAFAGRLDSIRLWSHALTPEELRERAARVSAVAGP